jgi:hypothetical protein
MPIRRRVAALVLGAALTASAAGIAAASPAVPLAPVEPIENCGVFPRNAPLEIENWNVGIVSCAEAMSVMNAFYDAAEKYATVDDWKCGIFGAAENEAQAGIAVQCKGPRGVLRLVQPD